MKTDTLRARLAALEARHAAERERATRAKAPAIEGPFYFPPGSIPCRPGDDPANPIPVPQSERKR